MFHHQQPQQSAKLRLVEGPKFHPDAVGGHLREFLKHPVVNGKKLGKFILMATGAYAIAFHTPPGEWARHEVGHGIASVGNGIDPRSGNHKTTAHSPAPTSASPEHDRLAEIQASLPKGTKILMEPVVAGDGVWNLLHRYNPGVSDTMLVNTHAKAYMEAEPAVADGLTHPEKVGVPVLPSHTTTG